MSEIWEDKSRIFQIFAKMIFAGQKWAEPLIFAEMYLRVIFRFNNISEDLILRFFVSKNKYERRKKSIPPKRKIFL